MFYCFREWRTKDSPEYTAKMLCHVTRPDSVVMEVEVDAKANGEDCLNKVGRINMFIYCDTTEKHGVIFECGTIAPTVWRNFKFNCTQNLISMSIRVL